MARHNMTKSQQKEFDKIKSRQDKEYGYKTYFSKIEKALKAFGFKTYGFVINSVIENKNRREIMIGATEYVGKEKEIVPYIIGVKVETSDDGTEKWLYKIIKTDMSMYNTHTNVYILNRDMED